MRLRETTEKITESQSKPGLSNGLRMVPLGRIPGPLLQGKKTFVVVLGLFDKHGNQAVHTYEDGEEKNLVVLTNPLFEDNTKASIFL